MTFPSGRNLVKICDRCNMTVLTTSVSVRNLTPLKKTRMRIKSVSETRPLTATLECPVILDITFLKKLDMTSFTKKGLIAISKICGISLVKRSDDKKIRKRLKRQTMERAKKEARKKSAQGEQDERNKPKLSEVRGAPPKIKMSEQTESVRPVAKTVSPRGRNTPVKPSIDDILYGPVEVVVIEPCKTCGRSEQPERFHSHPKQTSGRKQMLQNTSVSSLDESRKATLLPPKQVRAPRRHSTGHLQPKTNVPHSEPCFHSDHEIETIKMSLPKSGSGSEAKCRSEEGRPKKGKQRRSENPEEETKDDGSDSCREDIKYVVGCYVCGEETSPELRFAHEERCIAEWRKQNSQLPPDMRRAEPLRPDFRFTATGNVDFEGTFNSIWANHMDSLVPCAKCNRKFFPERIERHQACCNKQPVKNKFKTHRNK